MGKRVLIVDDAVFMRMMLKDILTKNGYEVCGEAENGKKAVEKYGELHPNLVTMDITMPEMDGISALKAIRAEDSAARVVMCSAMGQFKQLPFFSSLYLSFKIYPHIIFFRIAGNKL